MAAGKTATGSRALRDRLCSGVQFVGRDGKGEKPKTNAAGRASTKSLGRIKSNVLKIKAREMTDSEDVCRAATLRISCFLQLRRHCVSSKKLGSK